MSIGFVMSGPDNDSYMLRGPGRAPVCGSCGLVTDRAWVDPGFELKDSRSDLSYTYDGYVIVSDRFRDLAAGPGTRFIRLPYADGFYAPVVENLVEFDTDRRKTRFEQLCETCGRYFVVAGATPAFLRVEDALPDRIFRTDVEFGTGNEQHPLLIVGPEMAHRLAAAGLQGLDLSPVTGAGPKC